MPTPSPSSTPASPATSELCRVSMSVAISLAALSTSPITARLPGPSLALKLLYFSDLLRDAASNAAIVCLPPSDLSLIRDDDERIVAKVEAVVQSVRTYAPDSTHDVA
jgi:hypothetical protein